MFCYVINRQFMLFLQVATTMCGNIAGNEELLELSSTCKSRRIHEDS
jgi:hypothetical protein